MLHRLIARVRGGSPERGIWYMLLSVLFYVAGDLLIKGRLKDLPSTEVVFFRNLFGLVFLLAIPSKQPLILIGEKFWLLLSRGVLGFLSLSLFYYLLMHAPLANAVVFLQSATIFSAVIAFFTLREKLSPVQAVATVMGFIGIWLIVNPQIGISRYDVLGIALGIISALAHTSIKQLKPYYDSRSIVFSYLMVGVLLPLAFAVPGITMPMQSFDFLAAPFVQPGFDAIVILGCVAILTTLGQLYKTKAYSVDKAGVIGTIGYSRIAFALGAGILLGDGMPGPGALAGIALVMVAAIMVSYRNRSL